jgi:hypothetical protein
MQRCRFGLAGVVLCGLVGLPAFGGVVPKIGQFDTFGFASGDYRVTVDRTDAAMPRVEIAAEHMRPDEFGAVDWMYDVTPWRAKRIQITAEMQTTGDVLNGTLWARVDGPRTIVLDGPTESATDAVAPYRQLHGEHSWSAVYIVLDVPPDANHHTRGDDVTRRARDVAYDYAGDCRGRRRRCGHRIAGGPGGCTETHHRADRRGAPRSTRRRGTA